MICFAVSFESKTGERKARLKIFDVIVLIFLAVCDELGQFFHLPLPWLLGRAECFQIGKRNSSRGGSN